MSQLVIDKPCLAYYGINGEIAVAPFGKDLVLNHTFGEALGELLCQSGEFNLYHDLATAIEAVADQRGWQDLQDSGLPALKAERELIEAAQALLSAYSLDSGPPAANT